jgi:hypothetical protein
MTTRKMTGDRTEAIVARVLADPYTHQVNTDGGQAAAQFIREAAAGLHNPPRGSAAWHDREAARQERWRDIIAAISPAAR